MYLNDLTIYVGLSKVALVLINHAKKTVPGGGSSYVYGFLKSTFDTGDLSVSGSRETALNTQCVRGLMEQRAGLHVEVMVTRN
jgi:hypothetical protein